MTLCLLAYRLSWMGKSSPLRLFVGWIVGPIISDPRHPNRVRSHRPTNNTGELSCYRNSIEWMRLQPFKTLPLPAPGTTLSIVLNVFLKVHQAPSDWEDKRKHKCDGNKAGDILAARGASGGFAEVPTVARSANDLSVLTLLFLFDLLPLSEFLAGIHGSPHPPT